MMGLRDRIREQIEARFAVASLETSPFPHLIIEDFFPDDVYARLIEYNPFRTNRGVEWLEKSKSANVSSATPYFARKQINFHADQRFDAPDDQQDFWNDVKSCFLSDNWFPDLVRAKYPEYFRLRFGDLVDDSDFSSLFRRELFLQRHEPGYYIGPHTDIPTRVFTCIFAFARSSGFEEYGTELLAPKNRLDRCWGSDHYSPDGFTLKKVAPYKPNNFLLFFKTRHSFHAVRSIDDSVPDQRYGMQFQYYEPAHGLFNDLSTPDIMDVRRPKHLQDSAAKRAVRKIIAAVS
jgi:hypothetical protein